MGLKLIQDLIPEGRRNRPRLTLDGPRWITVHDTGNPSRRADALAHAAYLLSPTAANAPVSWHVTVDDERAVQHLPFDEVGWHAGDGRKAGGGNMASLGVEICENGGGDRAAAEDRAARVVAWLLRQHPTVGGVVQHHHWTGKDCPRVLRARPGGWEGFLAAVGRYRKEAGHVTEPWKIEAVDYFAEREMLSDPEKWKSTIDEPLPAWATFIMLQRIHEDMRRQVAVLTRDHDRRFR